MTEVDLYTNPAAMEPMFPDEEALEDLVIGVIRESAALSRMLHPTTRGPVVEMLRTINSYYSNLIEGHGTHPYDIERAMREEYSDEPAERALQLESRAHIEVERLIDERIEAELDMNICSPEFLCWIHQELYTRMPDEFRWVEDPKSGERMEVVPGALREHNVVAGRHVAPAHEAVGRFLARSSEVYNPSSLGDTRRVLAFAASHQRLLWIHPFPDGNGRVARLYTHAYAHKAGIASRGLWTVSRGLARRHEAYVVALEAADAGRWDDYDGRGNLSERGLNEFCKFFLETCRDQITYMSTMLDLRNLDRRIRGYVQLRFAGVVDEPKLRPEAEYLLTAAMHLGGIERREVSRLSGLGPRTARSLVSELTKEGLLYSDTPKGTLKLGLPMTAAEYYFPRLYSGSEA